MPVAVGLSPVYNIPQFFDAQGDPLAGGSVGTYLPGSFTTAQATYSTQDADVPNPNPIPLDSAGRLGTAIWLELGLLYNLVVRDALGNVLDSVDNVSNVLSSTHLEATSVSAETLVATQGQTVFSLDNQYVPGTHSLQVYVNGALQTLGADYAETAPGSITFSSPLNVDDTVRLLVFNVIIGSLTSAPAVSYLGGTVQDKLGESVSVRDFGAIGTADPGNEEADTVAFAAAIATGKNIFVPQGSYYVSSSIAPGYGQCLFGGGQFKTHVFYSGTGSAIYLGSPVLTSLIYNNEVRDLTVSCTNRAATVNGIELQNCVYFNLENLSVFGSGSPNDPDPVDRVLYGYGVYLHDNTIIGRLSHVSCRLWNIGRYYKTDAGNQSRWTASIVDEGQGELANCMRGIVVGDPTVPLYSGVGLTLRDLCFQGCYHGAISVNSGDNTVIEGCYFEGNGYRDIAVGSPYGSPLPIGVKIYNNTMNAEDIGVTPYGSFPYGEKIYVDQGDFVKIRDNNISISTAIPLIRIAPGVGETQITGNRLNSTAPVAGRIVDNGNVTTTAGNHPEAPSVATSYFTRNLDAASGAQVVTGVGFRPTSVEFFASVDTSSVRSVGACDASSAIRNRCLSTDAAGANHSSADCIRIIKDTAGNEQKAVLASFDADGFTLTWTKVGAPPANSLVVNYVARR
jgi:hypothetical protein